MFASIPPYSNIAIVCNANPTNSRVYIFLLTFELSSDSDQDLENERKHKITGYSDRIRSQ